MGGGVALDWERPGRAISLMITADSMDWAAAGGA
jgi:hypothetical protein